MSGKRWIWGVLWLAAGCVRVDLPPPDEAPTASVPRTVRVDATCVLPAAGPAVSNGVLVARLYEYDPRKADAPAREIGRTTLPGVSHRPGAETGVRFAVVGRTGAERAHYLTAVVYPEGAPAGESGLYQLEGFQRVLETGSRESLRATLVSVSEEDGPTN